MAKMKTGYYENMVKCYVVKFISNHGNPVWKVYAHDPVHAINLAEYWLKRVYIKFIIQEVHCEQSKEI